MPRILQELAAGNFSAPLTLIFIFFSLLSIYFLFKLGWIFFAGGDAFADSVEGKRQVQNNLRLLVACLAIALFAGFVFQFVFVGRDVAQQNAPGAARGFFDWLLGR